MPLYEYQCRQCGQVFEVMQKFSDVPLAVHEGCGGEVERLISTPALQFKGSGWYITDYARSGSQESKGKDAKTESSSSTAAGSDSGSSSGSSSSGSSKSE
jgi:putative FmdB family regulatory protein